MPGSLYITESVITGDLLSRKHQDQEEVCVVSRAILTPTAWDYIRDHGLSLARQGDDGPTASPTQSDTDVPEIRPDSMDDARLVQQGRCDYPNRAFGCETDEFGSGFAESGTPEERGTSQTRADATAGEDACGGDGEPADDPQVEALIQRITDEVMSRLGSQ